MMPSLWKRLTICFLICGMTVAIFGERFSKSISAKVSRPAVEESRTPGHSANDAVLTGEFLAKHGFVQLEDHHYYLKTIVLKELKTILQFSVTDLVEGISPHPGTDSAQVAIPAGACQVYYRSHDVKLNDETTVSADVLLTIDKERMEKDQQEILRTRIRNMPNPPRVTPAVLQKLGFVYSYGRRFEHGDMSMGVLFDLIELSPGSFRNIHFGNGNGERLFSSEFSEGDCTILIRNPGGLFGVDKTNGGKLTASLHGLVIVELLDSSR